MMSESTPPRSPEPDDPRTPAAFPREPARTNPAGPYPQSAWSYPPAQPSAPAGWRSSGTRVALVVVGSIVVGLLLFGGGYLTASVVDSIPGISDGRPGNDGPRMGPGGEWPGGGERGPDTRDDGPGDDSGDDADGSMDPSVLPGLTD